MIEGEPKVLIAAAGTYYFDPVEGPAFRAQVRADLEKIERERGR